LLASRARSTPFPLIEFAFLGTPREAIGYSMLLSLGLLSRLNYVPDYSSHVHQAVNLLGNMAEEIGPTAPADSNQAKRLAQHLYHRVGIIYGGGLMAEVARRWKGQLNENAKSWAFFEQLPELDHNAVLGYQFPTDAAQQHFVVMLSSTLNHPRISLREDVTAE